MLLLGCQRWLQSMIAGIESVIISGGAFRSGQAHVNMQLIEEIFMQMRTNYANCALSVVDYELHH